MFSGIFHKNLTFEEQEIWKLSREFGAECEYELSDTTTHLISNRIDTEKALESRERGIPAVKPEWIYECCRRWERVDYKEFRLEIVGRAGKKRSLADLEAEAEGEEEEEEEEEEGEISGVFEPILDEDDLEEIQRELEDLEDSEDGHGREDRDFEDDSFIDAELSDEDFSDLLNSSSANEETD